MNITDISINDLLSLNGAKNTTDLGTNDFCHYTPLDNLDNIINTKALWASPFSRINDLNEMKNRSANKNDYILCFCNSKTEQIPLWYLYSGGSTGGRIRLTASKMRNFLTSIEIIYPVINNIIDYNIPLYIDQDFSIKYGWCYYYKDDNLIRYRNTNYKLIEMSQQDILSKDLFFKDYEWKYEREFRIIISLKNNIQCDSLSVPFEAKYIQDILLSPEHNRKNDEHKALYSQGQLIKNSSLKCKMNILKKYFSSFPSYIQSVLDTGGFTAKEHSIINHIKEIIQEI
ncbi:MAG: hypothetical protein IJF38_06260 [Clostridia bacterium]|nr:hypothetical protein [Clostridia bacterium]